MHKKRPFIVMHKSLIEFWIIELRNFEVDRTKGCAREIRVWLIYLDTRFIMDDIYI